MEAGETGRTSSPAAIAAFDFDGTLAERDTLLPFLVCAGGRRRVARALVAQVRTYRRDRDLAKADLIRRVLAGADTASLETLGRDYAVGLHHLLRPEMAARVRWHRAEGHRLVIVSASLAVYLRPLADTLGFDHVIAVELESDPSGRLTGELLGPNVRGPEKARRLRAWMPENSVLRWAYGDSSGDDELLAIADHPVWVGRRAKRNSSTASGGSTSAGDPRGHFG